MNLNHQAPQFIEISSSSSAGPSSPMLVTNGRPDLVDDEMEPRRVSAASRVSLANLLGPTGPDSSPYPSPPRASPRKRFSEVSTRPARSPSPPPALRRSPPVSGGAAASEEEGPRSSYPDGLGEPSRPRGPSRRGSGLASLGEGDGVEGSGGVMANGREAGGKVERRSRSEEGPGANSDGPGRGQGQESGSGKGPGPGQGPGKQQGQGQGQGKSENQGRGGGDDEEASSDDGSASEPGEAGATSSAAKEVSKAKRRRRRTPSPPEPVGPAGPPPRPTIRISLTDSKKDGYLINVPQLIYVDLKAKKHAWAHWYEEQMEAVEAPAPTGSGAPALPPPGLDGGLARLLAKYPSESAGGGGGGGMGTDASKKRRRARPDDDLYDIGAYDTRDPFVDDSELGVDEPTHFAKPKADGFYVTQGPVELAKVKPGRSRAGPGGGAGAGASSTSRERVKPLSIRDSKSGFAGSINKLIAKRAQLSTTEAPNKDGKAAAAAAAAANGGGSMQVNSLLNSNGAGGSNGRANSTPNRTLAEGSRESPIKVDEIDENAPRPKKPRYPTVPVDPRLQTAFDDLKALVGKESFAVRTKFPPELKAPLVETAKLALQLGEYNDNFFNYLPTIFPYNRFTMMKLTKREFFPHHIKYFKDLQDEHMEALGRMIRESYPQQKVEYEAAHKAWEERGGPEQEGENPQASDAQDKGSGAPMDVDEGHAGAAAPTEEELQEPQKRWRWTEEMREEVFTLITIENAMSEVRNEKLKLENSADQFSEINARKSCYKSMAELFPEDGWTTSTNISREYAQLKKKKDRQEARLGVEVDEGRTGGTMPG